MKSPEQIKPYSIEEADEEASKMKEKINKTETRTCDYVDAEQLIEIDKIKKEGKQVFEAFEKKANGEKLSDSETNLIIESVQKAVQKAEGKLLKISWGDNGAYNTETGETLNEQEERQEIIENIKNEHKFIDPFFKSALAFVEKKHEKSSVATNFATTIEDYLDSADEYYKNKTAKYFNKYSLEYFSDVKNAEEYLKDNSDTELSDSLSKLKKAEHRLYVEAETEEQKDDAKSNLNGATFQLGSLLAIKLPENERFDKQFEKICEELSEDEKKFILAAIGSERENALNYGFARRGRFAGEGDGGDKEYVYKYHIGSTTTFMDSVTIMKNLEKIGINYDKYTQGGTDLRRKDIIKDMLAYMNLNDIKQLEEEKIENEKKTAQEKKFQEELKKTGFFEYIGKAKLEKDEIIFLINHFRENRNDMPYEFSNMSQESIKKADDGSIVFAKQGFSTMTRGKHVIDDVDTKVLVGKENVLLSSSVVNSRHFRTTEKGVIGYHPEQVKIKEVKHKDNEVEIELEEVESGKKIKSKLEIGKNIFCTNPEFKKNEKILREAMTEFRKGIEAGDDFLMPRSVDQRLMGKSLAQSGVSNIGNMPGEGYRKGKVELTGIKFYDVDKAFFEIRRDSEFAIATQKVEKTITKYEITLNPDGTAAIQNIGMEREKEYLY